MPSPTALRGVRELLTRTSAAAAQRLTMGRLRQISRDQSLPKTTRLEARSLRNDILRDIAAGNLGVVGLAHQAQIELAGLAERVSTLEAEIQQARADLSGRPTSEAAAALQKQVNDLTQELAVVKSALEQATDNLQIAQTLNQGLSASTQAEINRLNGELSQAKLALTQTNQALTAAEQRAQRVQAAAAAPLKVELVGSPVDSYANGHFALATDVGRSRKINQDSAGYAELADGRKVYLVADGMGGHGGGEIASKIVVREFISAVESGQSALEATITASRRVIEQALEEIRGELIQAVLTRATRENISEIIALSRSHGWSLLYIIENYGEIAQNYNLDLAQVQAFVNLIIQAAERKQFVGASGFGTTLVAAIVDESRPMLRLVQVGDSRIKAVTPTQAQVLTLDHSLKFMAYSSQQGAIALPISEAEIAKIDNWDFPASNVILSCLGAQSLSVRETLPGQAQPGPLLNKFEFKAPTHVRILEIPLRPAAEPTKLLLYSDGAIDNLPEQELSTTARSTDVPSEIAAGILDKALPVSNDNTTVAAISLPYTLDLDNLVELRTKVVNNSAQREILERVINGQVVAELTITPNGIVETAVQPDVTADLASTYDDIAALPLRNQLRYLSDRSADRDIAKRLASERLLPLCLTEKGYGRITAFLTDQDQTVVQAAQAVIHLWVLEKLKELSSPTIENNYYNQMIAFLAQNYAAELRTIINQDRIEITLRNMAVQIWQSVQPAQAPAAVPASQPTPAPVSRPAPQATIRQKQLNRALPLEAQLREIAQAKDSEIDFRDEAIDWLIDNKQVQPVQRHLRSKDAELRTGAERFFTRYLRLAFTRWMEENKGTSDPADYRGIRDAVKTYDAARLIERIAQDPDENADVKQLAGMLYQDLRPGRIARWLGNIFS